MKIRAKILKNRKPELYYIHLEMFPYIGGEGKTLEEAKSALYESWHNWLDLWKKGEVSFDDAIIYF